MASSNPLRPQNRSLQNQTGIHKHQEMNKTTLTAVGSSKIASENLDPNAETGVSKLKGISRLPVLAKSLQPAVNDVSQQNRWEQRPLAGKAQKKRICTKPVPFNLSQSRTHNQKNTDAASGKAPLTLSSRLTPGAKQPRSHKATPPGIFRTNKSQSAVLQTVGLLEHEASSKTSSLNCSGGHPSEAEHESRSSCQIDLSLRLGNITLMKSKLPEDSGLSHLCKDALVKCVDFDGQAPKDKQCIQTVQSHAGTKGSHSAISSAIHNVLSCDGSSTVKAQCVMPRLSTCPTGPGSSNNLPQRVSVKKSQREIVSTTGNARTFSPDPSALRSILQNDAMRVVERVGATPRTSTCPTGRPTSVYSAQRVPVRKPQTDEPSAVTGSTVSFSPDPSALRSILQNEGVKVGAFGGATPRVSTCPSGRGTSIYSAQRVPVKKTKTEATGTASLCANRTPVRTWTPQRVANTKPQSMRKLLTAQKMSRFRDSPVYSGPRDPNTELLMHQEKDVVQRLFEDPDQPDNDQTDKNDQPPTISTSHQTIDPLPNKDKSDSNHRHTEDKGKKAAQPFIQSAHRGSVIVFSSSQRICESDQSQRPVTGALLQLCGVSAASHNTLQSDQSHGSRVTSSSDTSKQIITCTQNQLKVSALRRRTPLEEMILDEECATYTSRSLSCPVQPRCGNPVATTLLFQDSTCFLPIGLSSGVRLSPVPSGSSIRAYTMCI